MTDNRAMGSRYEQQAAAFLEENGVRILERNFRCRQGEIDLIGREGNTIVFIEVKYRRTDQCGTPAEAVNMSKQLALCKTADAYRMKKHLYGNVSFRFDVIAILGRETTWYRNAFEYRGKGI